MNTKVISTTRIGAWGILKFLIKNYYIILIIISIMPTILASIDTAKETNNPYYPLIQVGLTMTNADSVIYENTQLLEENPEKVIGMEKPDEGLWKHTVYYWHVSLFIWKMLGLIFLITIPFMFFYKFIRGRNTSELYKNMLKTAIFGLLFILIVNMILVIYKFTAGEITYVFTDGIDIYKKVAVILYLNLPFHGLAKLISYLISII